MKPEKLTRSALDKALEELKKRFPDMRASKVVGCTCGSCKECVPSYPGVGWGKPEETSPQEDYR